MQLIFTKGGGSNPAKYDRLDIVTDAGPLAPIDCPKQGIIPHDMVHFAVEAEIAARGFLQLAADSGDAGFGIGGDDAHARSIERLVESFQAEAWDNRPADDAGLIGLYHMACDARGDAPIDLDSATVAAIRARMAGLASAWRAVPDGGTLVLALNVPTPG